MSQSFLSKEQQEELNELLVEFKDELEKEFDAYYKEKGEEAPLKKFIENYNERLQMSEEEIEKMKEDHKKQSEKDLLSKNEVFNITINILYMDLTSRKYDKENVKPVKDLLKKDDGSLMEHVTMIKFIEISSKNEYFFHAANSDIKYSSFECVWVKSYDKGILTLSIAWGMKLWDYSCTILGLFKEESNCIEEIKKVLGKSEEVEVKKIVLVLKTNSGDLKISIKKGSTQNGIFMEIVKAFFKYKKFDLKEHPYILKFFESIDVNRLDEKVTLDELFSAISKLNELYTSPLFNIKSIEDLKEIFKLTYYYNCAKLKYFLQFKK